MQTCSDFTEKDRLKSLLYNYECKRSSLASKRDEIEAEIKKADRLIKKYKAELRGVS